MSDKPNIVLIMTDQQRWDTLACLGFEHVITPNIDRLAGRGIAFTNAYVQGAVCGPSRNSIVSGMYDNTLFIFTSDHGDCLGDHHLVYKFSSHYDSVAKVPLVFAGPGVKGPGVRDQLVELIDLGPTLLDLVGLPPLDGAQGISMRSLIEGGSEELHDAVFSEQGQRVMVRTREWKMVAYLGESFGELYHLAEDPDELCNLYDVADCGGVRGDLAERLMHWYGSTRLRLPLYPG